MNQAITPEGPDLSTMSSEELLALTTMMMDKWERLELSELRDQQQETKLSDAERGRLDELMMIYRRGLLLKARALLEAVTRGLIPPLSSDVV
jgi:hypothetical protein